MAGAKKTTHFSEDSPQVLNQTDLDRANDRLSEKDDDASSKEDAANAPGSRV